MNRTGNPVYSTFGNESYSLLKKNKGKNTQYKIKQFFIDCLERMRRVYSVEYLKVYEVVDNPYMYKVIFKVLSVTNTLVDGEFYLNTSSNKSVSVLDLNYNHPYTSVSNPLVIDCILKNEYGSCIDGEVIYIYIKNSNDSKFKFYGITEATNYNGVASVTIPPNGLSAETQIMFVFRGNSLYNPCGSKIINIQSVAYYIKSRYTYKDVDGKEVIDKHILYIEDSLGNSLDKFRLGELLSDYIDINQITLSENIPIGDIVEYGRTDNVLVEYDNEQHILDYDRNKLYLVPTNRYIEGTNKVYYNAYSWNNDYSNLRLTPFTVQLNTSNPNEVHFLIEDSDNGLFEIDFEDGHLYYQIDLFDNEVG